MLFTALDLPTFILHYTSKMKLPILAVAVYMLGVALCQYSWDASEMLNFRADDNFHSIYDRKGNDYICAMRGSDRAAGIQLGDTRNPPSAESIWYRNNGRQWPTQLNMWFWKRVGPLPNACNFATLGWAQTLIDIVAMTGGDWECSEYVHRDLNSAAPIKDQTYKVHGMGSRMFQATGATLDLAFNRKHGVLLAESFFSPAGGAIKNWGRNSQNPITKDELPQIRQFSDFLWADWAYGVRSSKAT